MVYIDYPYVELTRSDVYPVTLQEAKDFLRVSSDEDDLIITGLIHSATSEAEKFTSRCILQRSYITYRPTFLNKITLYRSPFVSFDSAFYLENNTHVPIDLEEYYDFLPGDPYVRMFLKKTPPVTDSSSMAVGITFSAGWTPAPEIITTAIKMFISQLYENRGDAPSNRIMDAGGVGEDIKNLLKSYRIIPI